MKKFLLALIILALVGAGAAYAFDKWDKENDSAQPAATDQITTEPGSTNTVTDTSPSCGLTPATTEGPYYISETKQLTNGNLNYDNLPGDKIKVNGYVYGAADNTKPVPGAKVEIWHADNTGKYHPQSNGVASAYTEDQLSLRGYVVTDNKGFYEFTSIFPAEYEGRTRHIHARASADGYQPVITQMIAYVAGDQVMSENDNVARDLPSCNSLAFEVIDEVKVSSFNFHLAAQ